MRDAERKRRFNALHGCAKLARHGGQRQRSRAIASGNFTQNRVWPQPDAREARRPARESPERPSARRSRKRNPRTWKRRGGPRGQPRRGGDGQERRPLAGRGWPPGLRRRTGRRNRHGGQERGTLQGQSARLLGRPATARRCGKGCGTGSAACAAGGSTTGSARRGGRCRPGRLRGRALRRRHPDPIEFGAGANTGSLLHAPQEHVFRRRSPHREGLPLAP